MFIKKQIKISSFTFTPKHLNLECTGFAFGKNFYFDLFKFGIHDKRHNGLFVRHHNTRLYFSWPKVVYAAKRIMAGKRIGRMFRG